MTTSLSAAESRRVRRRLQELVARRPSDRRQALYAKSVSDLDQLRALAEAQEAQS